MDIESDVYKALEVSSRRQHSNTGHLQSQSVFSSADLSCAEARAGLLLCLHNSTTAFPLVSPCRLFFTVIFVFALVKSMSIHVS